MSRSHEKVSAPDIEEVPGALLWQSDPFGIHLSCLNGSAWSLLGYTDRPLELAPGFLRNHVHPDDWPVLLQAMYLASAEGGVHTCAHRMLRADQSEFWAQTSVCRTQRWNESAPALVGLTTDVSSIRNRENSAADPAADIKKQSEHELRESEEYYLKLVESVQDFSVFRVSTDGKVETWNLGAQRIKWYRANEILGSPITIFFPSEENEKGTVERLLNTASVQGNAVYEGWLVRNGGDRFWGVIALSPIEDEDGNLTGFTNVAKDLTNQKRTGDFLRQNEVRLRQLIDSVQDYAFFMMSPEGEVLDWNPGAQRVKGYRTQEIVGKHFRVFYPPEARDAGLPDVLLKKAKAEERAEYEGWIVRKNGTRIWATVVLSAIVDEHGELRGFSNIARDVSERRREDQARALLADVSSELSQSLDYRATIARMAELSVPSMADWCAVYLKSPAGGLELTAFAPNDSASATKIRGSLERAPVRLSERLGPGAVVRTGNPELYEDLTLFPPRKGEELHSFHAAVKDLGLASAMVVPLAVHGKILGSICFYMAESGRRLGPEHLRTAIELAGRTALAIENARLYESAQKAIQMREDVLAVVTHDLKNPVQAIQMSAEHLLRLAESGNGPPDTRKLAQNVRSAAQRMIQLIHDLLDFASIETGALRVQTTTCHVGSVLDSVIQMHQDLASGRGIRIEKHSEVSPYEAIRCDQGRLQQVFSNLVGNALRFTDQGGVVTLTARVEGGRMLFGVSDTGRGISKDDLPHVFDRYWQGKAGQSRESVGLGLAITKSIVDAHGGRIWVASVEGKGTTFFFTLPLEAGARSRAGAA